MNSRDMVNEILKINTNNNGMITYSEIIHILYVIYKDIEKIKSHLGIKIERR